MPLPNLLPQWLPWPRTAGASPATATPTPLLMLSLTALGVVYGDIGTSPLYAMRVCFSARFGLAVTEPNILGVLSLIFWALILIVSVKYQLVVLRADNRGEGGVLALLALLNPWRALRQNPYAPWLVTLGLLGAALTYCDGVLTPTISVLSAVEGLQIASPALIHYVLPITILILIGLFVLQRFGTARVGMLFGPIMVVWFFVIGLLGALAIARNPEVLTAINPLHGLRLLWHGGLPGFLVLGGVFLAVTGAETLYTDLGHVGRRPIRVTWFSYVLPALLLNYFGQGAFLLQNPQEIHHPFYSLAPSAALYPLVLLSTLATVIASQAVISAAFSLMRQAVQLGLTPRMRVVQTSAAEIGQIYIPGLNGLLMVACVALVLGFRSSDALAGAYGVALSTAMMITTLLMFVAMRHKWHWPAPLAGSVTLLFLTMELPFFLANLSKIPDGGWVPLAASGVIFIIMSTWSGGRRSLIDRLRQETDSLEALFERLDKTAVVRVPGTAIFMTAPKLGTPPALKHHLRHSEALHQQVILLTVLIEDQPRVPDEQRIQMETLGHGFHRVFVHYGFMQSPDLPKAMVLAHQLGLETDRDNTTYFIGRETLVIGDDMPMLQRWRERLYAFMFRNAMRATDHYKIPPDCAVETGIWVKSLPWKHRGSR